MSPVLDIKDLSIAYRTPGGDVRAASHVNLTINKGEVVGLCGESGSGKSTLAYGACRLLRPPAVITSGSVLYSGARTGTVMPVDILRLPHRDLRAIRWRDVAIVFQSAMNALNPVLRVSDQITDATTAHLRLPKDAAHEKAATLLDLVGIPRDRLRSYPHELRSTVSPLLPPRVFPFAVGIVVAMSKQLLAVQAGLALWLIGLIVSLIWLNWLFASLLLLAWTSLMLVRVALLAFWSIFTETFPA
jgi:ABC-type lipoprotein export system ATPase subunit